MTTRLSKRPDRLFIDVLSNDWQPSGAVGFDVTAGEGTDAFLPVATSIASVGAVYPSLVVTFSTETTGGETTYDFMTNSGPGQNRNGQLLVTARAADRESDYTGDAASHSAVTADELVSELIAEVEDVCLRNPEGGSTDFSYLGSQPAADVPDDLEATPPVRLAQCQVSYGWIRAQ